jgi:mannosyltransferase
MSTNPTNADAKSSRWQPLLPRRAWGAPFVLAVILLAGVFIRCYGLSARSLWFDEAFAWRITTFSWREMIERVARDNSPPLYYLCLKTWVSVFGTSPAALRSLSVLFGAVTIVGMYLFTLEALRTEPISGSKPRTDERRAKETALFVAALVALSIFQIRYAWEARMYTLGTALAALSSWALFRALHSPPRSVRPWLLYGFFALLFAYTHNYALFSITAQGLFVLGYLLVRADWNIGAVLREPRLWRLLLAASLVIVGWLPWLPSFLAQKAQVQAAYWTSDVGPWDVPTVCYQMFIQPEASLSPSRQFELWAMDLCILGLVALWRKAKPAEWYLLCASVTPFVLSILISILDTKTFGLRYFLFAHLFLLAGLAVLWARIPLRIERGLLGGFILTNALFIYINFWQEMDVAHKPGYRGAVEFIQQHRQADEPVIVDSPLIYFSILYYGRNEQGWRLYSSDGREIVHYLGRAAVIPQDIITDEQIRAAHVRRVWLVNQSGGYWGTFAGPTSRKWIQKSSKVFPETLGLGEVTVVEYAVAPE